MREIRKIEMIKVVRKSGHSGLIIVPSAFIGKEVKITIEVLDPIQQKSAKASS